MARLLNFPASLCSIAEQTYISGLNKGIGSDDDAGLVRLWTSDPVSSIQSSLSAEEKKARLDLVSNLLIGIHLCAAAESIAFAKHVGLPLTQLYELAVDAAGGSAMFRELGAKMISVLEGKGGEDVELKDYRERLREAVDEAQNIKCPVYLGSGALTALLQTGRNVDLGSLLKLYTVN